MDQVEKPFPEKLEKYCDQQSDERFAHDDPALPPEVVIFDKGNDCRRIAYRIGNDKKS